MVVVCVACGHEAEHVESCENETPYMENGYFRCSNPECGNGGRCAEAYNPFSYSLNGFREE